MARTSTQQVRVSASSLCRALRAAAAFADADKKSHRHRVNLRAVNLGTTEEPKMHLLIGGGNALRVIVVNAGSLDKFDDDFAVDIAVPAAARIVQMFAKTDGVTLKTDGKTMTVAATDAMFDNQEAKVRALAPEARSDALLIAGRLHTRVGVDDTTMNPMSSSDLQCIAAAAKAIGSGIELEDVELGDSSGIRVRFSAGAVGFVRTSAAWTSLAPGWDNALTVEIEEAWRAEHINVGHILDGALPNVTALKAVADADAEDAAEDEVVDGEVVEDGSDADEPIDLDAVDTDTELAEVI